MRPPRTRRALFGTALFGALLVRALLRGRGNGNGQGAGGAAAEEHAARELYVTTRAGRRELQKKSIRETLVTGVGAAMVLVGGANIIRAFQVRDLTNRAIVSGWRWDSWIEHDDAFAFVTAMLALVAALTIAITASAWRSPGEDMVDETNLQLWTGELAAVGQWAAAGSVTVALTRVLDRGPGLVLLFLAALTTVLSAASVQRRRDSVSLLLQLADAEEAVADAEARIDLLAPTIAGDVGGRHWRVAGFVAVVVVVQLGGLIWWVREVADPSSFLLQVGRALLLAAFLLPVPVYSVLGLLALYMPTTAKWNWTRWAGGAVVVVFTVSIVALAVNPEVSLERDVHKLLLGGMVVPFGFAWILVHLGRRGRGLGRGLFEVNQHIRSKDRDFRRRRLEDIKRRVRDREAHEAMN